MVRSVLEVARYTKMHFTCYVLIPGKLWYLASLWAQRCQLNQHILFWHSVTQLPTWQRNFINKSICRRKLYILYCIISCHKGICEQCFLNTVYSAPKREQGTWNNFCLMYTHLTVPLNYWPWPNLLCLLLKMLRSKTWTLDQRMFQTKLHYIMEDCNPKKY